MELREIYTQLNGNYDSVLGRLCSEVRIKKYLIKFMDANMSIRIFDALKAGDYETAFIESHNLKGVCANLNLDQLKMSASALTEALRGGKPEGDITDLVEKMQKDYEMTAKALQNLK